MKHDAVKQGEPAAIEAGRFADAASIRLPRLRPATSPHAFRLHEAALEWSLDAPIAINSEEDIKSKPGWQDHLEPFAHQIQNLITFCRRAPVTLLADDVGLGKTISAGLILSELMARKKVSRTLVLCPKLLLPQWVEEMQSKFQLDAAHESGAAFRHLIRADNAVTVTTYQTATNHFKAIRDAGFDMLILDEAHKVRNLFGTNRPPAFALAIRDALKDRVFKYVLMLTATPIQNRLWDLYSLIDLLATAKGHPNPLGSPSTFVHRYVGDSASQARKLNPGRREEFRRHLANYIVRTRRDDSRLVFPERSVRLIRAEATRGEQGFIRLISELFREERLNGLAQSSIGQALMSSPQALSRQLANMALKGTIPQEYSDEATDLAESCGVTGKLRVLHELIDELSQQRDDWRVVVFTTRKQTQEAIGEHLESIGVPVGYIKGGAARENQRAIKAFWQDNPAVRVLVSTDAGAEGVNLQVANVLVNFDLPWNPMIVEQRIGRVQRLGAQHQYVTVLNLVVAGSVEEHIVGRLSEKLQTISESLGDVESILESAGGGIDDEGGFETLIRNMVVASLKGQNVEEAVRRAGESIESGKRLFEEERAVVEENLGRLDELHRTGPKAPVITPVTPSMSVEHLVRAALQEDGATLEDAIDGTITMRLKGHQPVSITFSEDRLPPPPPTDSPFGGPRPRVYASGKPAFERLAQSWSERHGALVYRAPQDPRVAQRLAEEWLAQFAGAELVEIEGVRRSPAFQGELTLRASAAVAHDRFERLLRVPVNSGGHLQLNLNDVQGALIEDEVDVEELCSEIRDALPEAIVADPDIAEFVRFYDARLNEELRHAGELTTRREQVREWFETRLAADAVSMQGMLYDEVTLRVHYTLDGEGPVSSLLQLATATGQILDAPQTGRCEVTGRDVPADALAKCQVTGKRVIAHLLGASEESGRRALKSLLTTCPISGKVILEEELETSAMSGRRAVRSLFRESEVSGRKGLEDECSRCEASGAVALIDELTESEVSGRSVRKDELRRSVLSGRSGHELEMVMSVDPAGWIAIEESGRSDLSGIVVAKEHLRASARPPHRRGGRGEVVVCSASGRMLLTDEVGTSEVSGKTVDLELLVSSAASGAMALRQEMIACEDSGALLLPTETVTCAVTGKRVDRGRTAESAISGRPALVRELVRCHTSGEFALPDETEVCAVTGARDLPVALETCILTGRRVLREQMWQSVASGGYVSTDEGARTAMRARMGVEPHIIESVWSGGRMLRFEAQRCALTDLWLEPTLMNEAGEFKYLRDLLDGREGHLEVVPIPYGLWSWLSSNVPLLRRAAAGVCVASPIGCVAWVARCGSGFLGRRGEVLGGVLTVRKGQDPQPRAAALLGSRRGGRWQQKLPDEIR